MTKAEELREITFSKPENFPAINHVLQTSLCYYFVDQITNQIESLHIGYTLPVTIYVYFLCNYYGPTTFVQLLSRIWEKRWDQCENLQVDSNI